MSRIIIDRYVLGMIRTNVYCLYREDSSECVVVDPADMGAELYEKLKKDGLDVKAILITHGHFDHILGVAALKEKSGAKIYANEAEFKFCTDANFNNSANYGRPAAFHADRWLHDGEVFTEAGITFKMIATPGHSEGSCCYYVEGNDADGSKGGTPDQPVLISGDTLFRASCGRTDFPTGSMSAIVHSIKDKLFLLPNDTVVYPGHESFTTIEYEKKNNPYV